MNALLFLIPLFATALIIVPLALAIHKRHSGKKVNAKHVIIRNALTFIGVMATMTFVLPLIASAAEPVAEAAANGLADGMKYLGAALSTGLATVGTGIAVGGAAPAAIGATSEDEKNFTKSLIFVALGEGVAIYGLLISILILFS